MNRFYQGFKFIFLILSINLIGCKNQLPTAKFSIDKLVPKSYSLKQIDTSIRSSYWWYDFDDPVLNQLMTDVFKSNFDLQRYWGRLEQVKALADQIGASRHLQLNLNASATRVKNKVLLNDYILSVAASYELDLWQRLREQEKAAVFNWHASREDFETIAMSLASQIASLWYTLVTKQAELQLVKDQILTRMRYLLLSEQRFLKGLVPVLDLLQYRQTLAALQRRVPTIQAEYQLTRHQLSVLLGKAPTASLPPVKRMSLPDLSAFPPLGIPLTLLQDRPDLRAAQHRITADNLLLSVALRNRMPSLRLGASFGYKSAEIHRLFDYQIWNLASELLAPFLDGHRRRAERKQAEAKLKVQLAAYSQQALKAFQEVEDALTQEQEQEQKLIHLKAQMASAQRALDDTRLHYQQGLVDGMIFLRALETIQILKQQYLNTNFLRLISRISLYRSLGGSWTRQLTQNGLKKAQGQ